MLSRLEISNYAIVDRLAVDFERGFSVITGETGSGKSILLGALSLALGERAKTDALRPGSERGEVIVEFDLAQREAAKDWLRAQELTDPDDENLCLLRRTLSADGRSRAYVNGSAVTLSALRTLTSQLIDVHAQHEHQVLLRRDTQRDLLDEFAGAQDLVNEVRAAWHQWQQASTKLAAAQQASQTQQAEAQLLTYQREELAELAAQPGEFETLGTEQKRLDQADNYLAVLNGVSERLSDENAGLRESLRRCVQDLERLDDDAPALGNAIELFRSAEIHLDEAEQAVVDFAQTVDPDPQRLQQVESRLSALWNAARKHDTEPRALPERLNEIDTQLASFKALNDDCAELEIAVETHHKSWREQAEKLSKARKKAVKPFTKAVQQELTTLNMGDTRLAIELTAVENEHGLESVALLIATQKDAPPRPLGDIASGGELSRISLAIQIVAARNSQLQTLILDEADVGIGGGTAEAVGQLLRRLGESAQILSITHQPQVAAQGHSHLTVNKRSKGGPEIRALDAEAREEELARMLGGQKITATTRQHAREMLAQSA